MVRFRCLLIFIVSFSILMSTWSTEAFRGEHLQALASLKGVSWDEFKAFCHVASVTLTGGEFVGVKKVRGVISPQKYVYPTGETRDIVAGGHPHEALLKEIFYDWPQAKHSRDSRDGRALVRFSEDHQDCRWYCGLEAVYKLSESLESVFEGEDLYTSNSKWVTDFIKEAMVGYSEAKRLHPAIAAREADSIHRELLSEYLSLKERAKAIRSLIRLRFSKSGRLAKEQYVDDGHSKFAVPGVSKAFEILPAGKLIMLRWRARKIVYCLTTPDLDRLQQMTVSRSMLKLALATADASHLDHSIPLRKHVNSELANLLEVCSRCTYMEAQVACKGFKKAMDLYQSYVSGPLSDERRASLIADLRELPSCFELEAFVRRLQKMPLDIAQEAGKVYRVLCAPDYDIGASYVKRALALHSPNPVGPHIHKESALEEDELEAYLVSIILDGAAKRNGMKGVGVFIGVQPTWWDDWIAHGRHPRGVEWVSHIDYTGVLPWRDPEMLDPDVWKDSTACEEDWESVMRREQDRKTMPRNCLTRLLRDDSCPDYASSARTIRREEHINRAGFKQEAHKDVSRIFYIGNLSDRMYGSALESNIADTAKHIAGFTVGAGIDEVVKRVGGCYAPDVDEGRETFHISSDYEQWSPGMRGSVQRMSHKVWARMFGKTELEYQRYINEGAYLLLNKRGYVGAVQNPEANFEGLNGKEMTVLHCALVAYTIFRARRGGLAIPTADFAAFIDDAALSLTLDAKKGPEIFEKFFAYYVETTAHFGFKLDVAKCYLSNRFMIYLNEVYYGGRHIAHGLRAVSRIGTREGVRCESLTQVLEQIGAGCRGAAKCGLHPLQIWKCSIVSVAIELVERGVHNVLSGNSAVLYAYGPRALHCLQAPMGLTLDCNYSGGGNVESMAYTKRYAALNPHVKQRFIHLVRTGIVSSSGSALLQNYKSVRPTGTCLKTDYLSGVVSSKLSEFTTSSVGGLILTMGRMDFSEQLGVHLMKSCGSVAALHLAHLEKVNPGSVYNAFVKKFSSAGTLSMLVGNRKMRAIEKSIIRQEGDHCEQFRRLVARAG